MWNRSKQPHSGKEQQIMSIMGICESLIALRESLTHPFRSNSKYKAKLNQLADEWNEVSGLLKENIPEALRERLLRITENFAFEELNIIEEILLEIENLPSDNISYRKEINLIRELSGHWDKRVDVLRLFLFSIKISPQLAKKYYEITERHLGFRLEILHAILIRLNLLGENNALNIQDTMPIESLSKELINAWNAVEALYLLLLSLGDISAELHKQWAVGAKGFILWQFNRLYLLLDTQCSKHKDIEQGWELVRILCTRLHADQTLIPQAEALELYKYLSLIKDKYLSLQRQRVQLSLLAQIPPIIAMPDPNIWGYDIEWGPDIKYDGPGILKSQWDDSDLRHMSRAKGEVDVKTQPIWHMVCKKIGLGPIPYFNEALQNRLPSLFRSFSVIFKPGPCGPTILEIIKSFNGKNVETSSIHIVDFTENREKKQIDGKQLARKEDWITHQILEANIHHRPLRDHTSLVAYQDGEIEKFKWYSVELFKSDCIRFFRIARDPLKAFYIHCNAGMCRSVACVIGILGQFWIHNESELNTCYSLTDIIKFVHEKHNDAKASIAEFGEDHWRLNLLLYWFALLYEHIDKIDCICAQEDLTGTGADIKSLLDTYLTLSIVEQQIAIIPECIRYKDKARLVIVQILAQLQDSKMQNLFQGFTKQHCCQLFYWLLENRNANIVGTCFCMLNMELMNASLQELYDRVYKDEQAFLERLLQIYHALPFAEQDIFKNRILSNNSPKIKAIFQQYIVSSKPTEVTTKCELPLTPPSSRRKRCAPVELEQRVLSLMKSDAIKVEQQRLNRILELNTTLKAELEHKILQWQGLEEKQIRSELEKICISWRVQICQFEPEPCKIYVEFWDIIEALCRKGIINADYYAIFAEISKGWLGNQGVRCHSEPLKSEQQLVDILVEIISSRIFGRHKVPACLPYIRQYLLNQNFENEEDFYANYYKIEEMVYNQFRHRSHQDTHEALDILETALEKSGRESYQLYLINLLDESDKQRIKKALHNLFTSSFPDSVVLREINGILAKLHRITDKRRYFKSDQTDGNTDVLQYLCRELSLEKTDHIQDRLQVLALEWDTETRVIRSLEEAALQRMAIDIYRFIGEELFKAEHDFTELVTGISTTMLRQKNQSQAVKFILQYMKKINHILQFVSREAKLVLFKRLFKFYIGRLANGEVRYIRELWSDIGGTEPLSSTRKVHPVLCENILLVVERIISDVTISSAHKIKTCRALLDAAKAGINGNELCQFMLEKAGIEFGIQKERGSLVFDVYGWDQIQSTIESACAEIELVNFLTEYDKPPILNAVYLLSFIHQLYSILSKIIVLDKLNIKISCHLLEVLQNTKKLLMDLQKDLDGTPDECDNAMLIIEREIKCGAYDTTISLWLKKLDNFIQVVLNQKSASEIVKQHFASKLHDFLIKPDEINEKNLLAAVDYLHAVAKPNIPKEDSFASIIRQILEQIDDHLLSGEIKSQFEKDIKDIIYDCKTKSSPCFFYINLYKTIRTWMSLSESEMGKLLNTVCKIILDNKSSELKTEILQPFIKTLDDYLIQPEDEIINNNLHWIAHELEALGNMILQSQQSQIIEQQDFAIGWVELLGKAGEPLILLKLAQCKNSTVARLYEPSKELLHQRLLPKYQSIRLIIKEIEKSAPKLAEQLRSIIDDYSFRHNGDLTTVEQILDTSRSTPSDIIALFHEAIKRSYQSLCDGAGFQVLQQYGIIFVKFKITNLQQNSLSQPIVYPFNTTFDTAQSYIKNYISRILQDLIAKRKSIKRDDSDFDGYTGTTYIEDKKGAESALLDKEISQPLKNFLIELLMIRNENGVLISFGAIATWILNFLLGITESESRVIKAQTGSLSDFACNDSYIRIQATLPFQLKKENSTQDIGAMEICVHIPRDAMEISIEQFEVVIRNPEICELIERKIADCKAEILPPVSVQHASTLGIFTPSPKKPSQPASSAQYDSSAPSL